MTVEFPWQPLLESATVRIWAPSPNGNELKFLGTGFFVSPRRLATAAHVLRGYSLVVAELNSGQRVDLIVENSVGDAAILRPAPSDRQEASSRYSTTSRAVSEKFVMCCDIVQTGDSAVTYGFPVGDYSGQPATLTAVGKSNIGADGLFRYRAVGLAPGNGASGSPVLNLRTGGVYGLVSHSNQKTRAHLEPMTLIMELLPAEERVLRPDWLDELSDEQLCEGRWSWATRELKDYVRASLTYYDTHPYAGILIEDKSPPLSSVHVRQSYLEWEATEETANAKVHRPDAVPSDQAPGLRGSPALEDVMGGGLLVGAPGGGKSSALRMLARRACVDFTPGIAADIPILIDASEIELGRPLAATIAEVTNNRFANGESRFSKDFFSNVPMASGRWQLIVDGLDEILDSHSRTSIVKKAIEFMSSDLEGRSRIVFATRPLPKDEMEILRQLTSGGVWELRSFEPEKIAEVLGHWFRAVGHEKIDHSTNSVLAQLGGQRELALLRNPLMLTMVCQLYCWNPDLKIPKTRTALYEKFTLALRERFYGRGPGNALTQASAVVSRYGPTAMNHVDVVVERVYHIVGVVALDWLSTDSLPDLGKALEISTAPLNMRAADWVQLSHEITRRSGIVMQEGESLKFLHQTLAEYLASWTLAEVEETNRLALTQLSEPTSRLGRKHSFIRFAADSWLGEERFVTWLVNEIWTHNALGTELASQIIEDGLELPKIVREAFVSSLTDSLSSSTDLDAAAIIAIIQRLSLAAEPALIENVLTQMILETKWHQEIRLWAISELAARISGSKPGPAADELPTATSVDQAIDRLAVSAKPEILELMSVIASDSSLGLFVQQRALHSLGEQVKIDPGTADLLPRINSLARPTGALALLTKTLQAHNPNADIALIKRAYATAESAHSDLGHMSGEPYIIEAVAVATILAELGLGETTLAAALLHHVVEDTPYTFADLKRDFGPDVAMLVDGVRKLDKVGFGETAQAGTVRKMVVAMAKDIRVLMIKLASRLQDARTSRFVSADSSAAWKARETLEIFAPLAGQLGLVTIESELEDLSFATLYPKVYEEIVRMVSERIPDRERVLDETVPAIKVALRGAKIGATVSGRPKHYYSIYKKMIVQDKDFDDINDLVGVRILVDSVRDCYAALGTMHSLWNPVPGNYRDYIAMPKFDMYQSLHTTVMGPGGKPVEIQIRTRDMHRRAEYGVSARSKYKDQPSRTAGVPGSSRDGDMGWLRSLVDWRQETSDPGEFLDSLRFEINAREVFVFTPKGEVMALPIGSTPVDFAYAVHTDVGHRAIGARVNSKLVPLNTELNHGDWVEIFTSNAEGAGPSLHWQHFVKSRRARNKIRQWFRNENSKS